MNLINANARSLGPKLTSLVDCFDQKNVSIACLTETWFQANSVSLEDNLRDLSDNHCLSVIHRTRSARAPNGRFYGGVAVVYRQKNCTFKQFDLVNPEDYEVLAAVGKVTGFKGKVAIISAYIPPNYTTMRAASAQEYISDVVGEIKRQFNDCWIFLAGDFNQWGISTITNEHNDIKLVRTEPTRGNLTIDLCCTNFHRSITESYTLEPLEDEFGSKSDHRIVFVSASPPLLQKSLSLTHTGISPTREKLSLKTGSQAATGARST